MSDHVKGKVKKAVTAVAGATVSEVLGNALTPGSPSAPPPQPEPAAAETAAHDTSGHEYVPHVETTTVTRGEDGSVEAQTGTTWHPETADGTPLADLPTVEEFEQIDVHEDAFGNFVIDATERFVVHNHGHDEVYVDHQHLVVPGDGTPGDTDIDIFQDAEVVVHENPDGTISVEHGGSLSYALTPDAPGHGDIEVFQEETVVLDAAETGPPGIEVGITADEKATAEDPFGEPAGPTIHQTETVGDRARGTSVTTSVTAPAPSVPGPPTAPAVTFSRQPSTVDAPAAAPVAVETATLATSSALADHPASKPLGFATEKPSFANEPERAHHDAGEVTGSRPEPREEHPFEPPKDHHHEPDPADTTAEPPEHDRHDPLPPEPPGPPEHEQPPEEPQPVPDADEHHHFDDHHAHADGGG
ncbi:hypothetical protein VA596_18745 [Amycolatopsis sp., V23-08]|uniref:Uncharacterized protein n=1 Tax=Amycolatopsis heterodermiae TaxID=3110235 RepID=A0ABU5R6Z6_9PSEU|nr:hypothetical protein [Amycolatopsis sp., V23-08]MEA5361589.1 hypothetical protein [Amycolatopsis sp., V23-08]